MSQGSQHSLPPVPAPRQALTSVPCLARAALPSCRIFSRYIWAARLLYLLLASLTVHPCWRKKAVCGVRKRRAHYR